MIRIHAATERVHGDRRDRQNLRGMLPYLAEFRGRALLALGCLVLAKLANVGVPMVLKDIVDAFEEAEGAILALPVGLLAPVSRPGLLGFFPDDFPHLALVPGGTGLR